MRTELQTDVTRPPANRDNAIRREERIARLAGSAWLIFCIALLVRTAVWVHGMVSLPQDQLWGPSEAAHIAVSLVSGHGYSGAFGNSMLPTAWLAPGYPVLVALIFALLGSYTHAATGVLMAINALAGATTAVLVQRLGARYFSRAVGTVAAWIWVFWYYLAVFVLVLWDTEVSALLVCFSLLLLPAWARSGSRVAWLGIGVFWGLACLWNPSLISLAAFSTLYFVWRQRSGRLFVHVLLTFLAVIAPWLVRNYVTFHKFVFLRSNLYAELYYSNRPGLGDTNGDFITFPDRNPEYNALGEQEYLARKRVAFWDYLRGHRMEFLRRSIWRGGRFWSNPSFMGWTWTLASLVALAGVFFALRQNRDFAFLAIGYVITYPAIYYLTYAYPKYRHPIEPIVVLFLGCAAVGVVSNLKTVFEGRFTA